MDDVFFIKKKKADPRACLYFHLIFGDFDILLKVILPMKQNTFESLLKQIAWIQARNHRAYLSSKPRRIRELIKDNKYRCRVRRPSLWIRNNFLFP